MQVTVYDRLVTERPVLQINLPIWADPKKPGHSESNWAIPSTLTLGVAQGCYR